MRVGSSSVKYFSTSFPAEASHASTDSGADGVGLGAVVLSRREQLGDAGLLAQLGPGGLQQLLGGLDGALGGREVVEPLEHGVHERAADRGEALALGQPVDRAEAVEQGQVLKSAARLGDSEGRRGACASSVAGHPRPRARADRRPSAAVAVMVPRLGRPTDSSECPRRSAATQVTSGRLRTLAARGHAAGAADDRSSRAEPAVAARAAGAGGGRVRRRRPGAADRPEGPAAHRRPRAGQAVPHPPRRDRARRPDRRPRGLRRASRRRTPATWRSGRCCRLRAVHAARRAGDLPEGRRPDRRLRRHRPGHAGARGRRRAPAR